MKSEVFKSWKARFLAETDPNIGTKIAFRLNDFHETYISRVSFLDSIEGIEYDIVYRSSAKSDTAITFKSLKEFSAAQRQSVYDSREYKAAHKSFGDRLLDINLGYVDLGFTIPYTTQNLEKLVTAGMVPKQVSGQNYNGRPFAVV